MAGLDLQELMRAAGSSLGDAQGSLLTGIDAAPTTMAIAEATLEMKLTIDSVNGGALQVAPVSAADARTGAIDVGALSSVTMRFIPFGNDLPSQITTPKSPTPAGGTTQPGTTVPPRTKQPLTRADAEATLRQRPDIARRIAAGEAVKLETVEVAIDDRRTWVITARDPSGASIAAAQFSAKE